MRCCWAQYSSPRIRQPLREVHFLLGETPALPPTPTVSLVHATWVVAVFAFSRLQLISPGWATEAEAALHYMFWVVWLKSKGGASLSPP